MTKLTDILPRVVRELGGRSGNVVSGDATNAVLEGLVGTTPDDLTHAKDMLLFPDAANDSDRERLVNTWAALTGTATWLTARTDTTYTGESYALVPRDLRIGLVDIRAAAREALRETRRQIATVIPTRDDTNRYSLAALTWLRNDDDVRGVKYRASKNLVDDESFELWGTAAKLHAWTPGANLTVARVAENRVTGGYVARLTASGASELRQAIGLLNEQLIGKSVEARLIGECDTASALRLRLDFGVSTVESVYHTGGGAAETLSISTTVPAGATKFDIVVLTDLASVSDLHLAVAVEGTTVDDALLENGSEYWVEEEVVYDLPNRTGTPTINLSSRTRRGHQLVVYTLAPFDEVTTDTEESDIPANAWEHGTVYHLLSGERPGQAHRKLLDRKMTRAGNAWGESVHGLDDQPVPDLDPPVIIGG